MAKGHGRKAATMLISFSAAMRDPDLWPQALTRDVCNSQVARCHRSEDRACASANEAPQHPKGQGPPTRSAQHPALSPFQSVWPSCHSF